MDLEKGLMKRQNIWHSDCPKETGGCNEKK